MNTWIVRSHIWVGTILLVSYCWIALFGLFQTSHMSHATADAHHCPYMVGEYSICPMSTTHHLNAWQVYTHAIMPLFEILAIGLCVYAWLRLQYISPHRLLYAKLKYYHSPVPLYRHLFSQGILNAKAP